MNETFLIRVRLKIRTIILSNRRHEHQPNRSFLLSLVLNGKHKKGFLPANGAECEIYARKFSLISSPGRNKEAIGRLTAE